MTAFIVPRDSAGLSVGEPLGKLGQNAAPTAEVFLENVFVPEDHRLARRAAALRWRCRPSTTAADGRAFGGG